MDIEIEEFAEGHQLTPKEREVFHHFIHGRTLFKDIASQINSSHHTVNNHFKNIFKKMQVSSKSDLLAMFLDFYSKKCERSLAFTRTPCVLLIDDDELFSQLAKERLAERGVKTFIADSEQQALKILTCERIDLIMIDVRMPAKGGLDLVGEIKKHYPYYPGIYLITGYLNDVEPREYYQRGAFGVIGKPIDFDSLFLTVMYQFRDDRGLCVESFEHPKDLCPALIVKPDHIGVGGLYIDLDRSLFEQSSAKELGDIVNFDFCVDGQGKELIQTKSEITWFYETPLHQDKIYIGLKFRSMKPVDQIKIESIAKENQVISVIPSCQF